MKRLKPGRSPLRFLFYFSPVTIDRYRLPWMNSSASRTSFALPMTNGTL